MEGQPNPQAQIFWSSSLLVVNRGLISSQWVCFCLLSTPHISVSHSTLGVFI